MKKSWTMSCPQTGRAGQLFCYSQGCKLPAFGCSDVCLSSHQHSDRMFWSQVEGQVRHVLERELETSDLQALEFQQKQLLILIDGLKTQQQKHSEFLVRCRQKLQVRKDLDKVLKALAMRATTEITGNDMHQLIKRMRSNDLFANGKEIEQAIVRHNTMVNRLLESLHRLANEHKLQISQFPVPGEFLKVSCEIDLNTSNASKIIVTDGVFTIATETQGRFYPIFLKQPLTNGRSFEVEVVDAAVRYFAVGVATGDVRNTTYNFLSKDNLCLKASGTLVSDGIQRSLDFKFKTGDRLIVQCHGQQIEWLCNRSLIFACAIAGRLVGKPLFPVCWIASHCDSNWISRLRVI